ncbi:MAG: hypothetical protein JWP72_178 [Massilia sp.]|nr:hypothetical protein [Massilia sp.]MDB5791114.1 hypothetical protein [Massilia sp.]
MAQLSIRITPALAVLGCLALLTGGGAAAAEQIVRANAAQQRASVKIRIDVGGTPVIVSLDNNETSRDFASLLPLTLSLDDYAGTEKISQLPRRLSTRGAPAATAPVAGDLAYYAPWGNIAIFYKDGEHSPGLVRLGKIESCLGAFRQAGSRTATITLLGND